MPIANALVPVVQQNVVRHASHIDVILHLVESPPAKRVDFDQASRVNLEGLQRSAVGALGTTTAGDDCFDAEFRIRATGRFDLGGGDTTISQDSPRRDRRPQVLTLTT